MTLNPRHQADDPVDYLNQLEAALLAARLQDTGCASCVLRCDPVPGTGTGWVVEVFHEAQCPEHDNNLPTPQRPGRRA